MYTKEIKVLNGLKCGYYQFRDHEHPLCYADGSVYLHRHIASINLGRWLTTDEHVHHLDENRLNNDDSNLILLTNSEHSKLHNPMSEYSSDGRTLETYMCSTCGIEFHPLRASKTKLYCSPECSHKAAIKNKELTKEVLDELIPITSWVALGGMFGYTDNGIKKRAKALGCDITKSKNRRKKQ